MERGLSGALPVLGNSFLSHFSVKLDAKAGQLHLTRIDAADKKPASADADEPVADEAPMPEVKPKRNAKPKPEVNNAPNDSPN